MMKCIMCGFENTAGAKFCEKCGAPLAATEEQAAQPVESQPVKPEDMNEPKAQAAFGNTDAAEKRKNNLIKYGIGAVFALVFIVIICSAIFKHDNKYDFIDNSYRYYYVKDDEKTTIIYNNKVIKDTVDGKVIDFYSNDDNTFAAFTAAAEKDNDSEKSKGYTLYTLTKKKLEKVADDITRINDVADEGRVFVYTDSDGKSYFWKNGKSTKFAEDASGIIISPDGKSLVYSEKDDDDSVLKYFNGKKSVKIGKNLTAEALSNGGKYIYIKNEEGNLYVTSAKKPDDKTKIASAEDEDKPRIRVTNKDGTQIIYSLKEKTYLVKKGNAEKKIKLTNTSALYLVTPSDASYKVDNLLDEFYASSEGALYYVNKKGEAQKIASELSNAFLSDDGKVVYYQKKSDLYRVKANKLDDAKKIAEDVSDFEITPDGKAAYYIDKDETLFYIKGTGKAKRITDEVDGSLRVTKQGIALFLKDVDESTGRGTLYSSKNGGKSKKVADDVKRVQTTATAAYYSTNYDGGTYDLYVAESGTKFKLIVKGVES